MLHTLNNSNFESPLLRPSSACSVGSPKLPLPSFKSLNESSAASVAAPESDSMFENEFGVLIGKLRKILGPNKGLSSEDVDIEKVKEIMEEYTSNEEEWGKFALHDPSRNYSRNGIVDINGNANLLILVWSPGKASAIHDHANAHCCMKILKGELKESLYDIPNVEEEGEHELVCKQETNLKTDVVGYISDDIGLHKISNNLDNEVSVSLHLYTPPYASMFGCSMYEAKNGKKHHVDMSKYYSWQGELVNKTGSSTC
ncbi:cysteine dioxygenase Cdg1p [[Candida] railenensis]|uniref:Cysteine dioxygenase n=1 Tax=[Candida] railenensis TaxID=45579 RepID=A0A9P0VZ50_9ASCO|nr:cysteine dioxygenase Cdg1p [[Candida] railenensis]